MHALCGSSVLAHQLLFHPCWEYRALATVQAGYWLPGEQLCWKDAGSKLSDSLCSRNKECSRNKDTQKHPELYQHKTEWSNYSPFLFRPHCGSESSLGLPSTGETWANWRKFREGTSVWLKLGHLLLWRSWKTRPGSGSSRADQQQTPSVQWEANKVWPGSSQGKKRHWLKDDKFRTNSEQFFFFFSPQEPWE